jgi:hypothetical protein
MYSPLLTQSARAAVDLAVTLANLHEQHGNLVRHLRLARDAARRVSDHQQVEQAKTLQWRMWAKSVDFWLWAALDRKLGRTAPLAAGKGRPYRRWYSRARPEIDHHLRALRMMLEGSPPQINVTRDARPLTYAAWGVALLLEGTAACTTSGRTFTEFFGRCGWRGCLQWFFRPPGVRSSRRGPPPTCCGIRGHQNAYNQEQARQRAGSPRGRGRKR